MAYEAPDPLGESDPTANQAVPDGRGNMVFRTTTPPTPEQIAQIKKVYKGPLQIDSHGITVPTRYFTKTMGLVIAAVIAAPFAAAALAGTGAGGAAPVATGAAPAGIADVGGTAGAGLGIPGVGVGVGPLAPSAGSAAGTFATGARFANLASGALREVQDARGGGQAGADSSVAAENRADQAARNRYLEALAAQNGPNADAQALRNSVHSGDIAGFKPSSVDTPYGNFGRTPIAVSDQTRGFATGMRDELARRMAAKEPLTLSGVPPKTQQELDDEKLAMGPQNRAGDRFGKLADRIDTGVRLATYGKRIWDLF